MSNEFSLESGGVDAARVARRCRRFRLRGKSQPTSVGASDLDIEHAAHPSVSGGDINQQP